jgi:two-component system cell cycle sensor histidine kinase/response regulator CckA
MNMKTNNKFSKIPATQNIERKINEEQLRQVQRMESLGKLSAGIAHEFNNILAVIEGHAELLKMKRSTDEPLVKSLNSILDASGRAAHLTNSMMAYTQKQFSSPEVADLSNVVYEMDMILSNILRKDLNLEIELSREQLPVYIDVGQLEQVMMNLATNGRDALSSGGTLVVRTGATDRLPADLETAGENDRNRYAVLTVSDNGCGMSSTIREKMYEPYFTTKDVGKGTGLGLSVAQGIIAQHNGHISCVSEEGKGTTFTIHFPLAEGTNTLDQDVSRRGGVDGNEPLLLQAQTVLLVDDDSMVRDVVKEILESGGYMVMSAADGDEALEIYQRHASSIDLVVLDFNLPQKNGAQVVKELAIAQCNAPVLLMSGDLSDAQDSEFDPAVEVIMLSKPFLPSTLLNKAKEMIDEKH